MRQTYRVYTEEGNKIQVADRITITPNGDLSFVDVKLMEKTVNGNKVMVEDPAPILVLSKGNWKRVEVVKSSAEDL